MAEQATATAAQTIRVPDDTRAKFPEFIELILGSHSMDDEERQYWVDVLPIMTDDQLKNLKDILTNEKKQLEEANKTYTEGVKSEAQKAATHFDEAAYLEKKKMRLEAEQKDEEEDKKSEEQLLKDLQNL